MESISKILNEELCKKVESILINQIIETHKTIYYEEVMLRIQNIPSVLNQKYSFSNS